MPELPEVETIRRQLESEIAGATISSVQVFDARKINMSGAEFARAVQGKKITGVLRRAKLLMIRLSGGLTMAIHLKMTGHVFIEPKLRGPRKHSFVSFVLSNGKQLIWEDVRKFGFLKLLDEAEMEKYLESQGYGPEPLEKSFSAKVLAECLRRHGKKKIKQLLMEQSCIAGVGNIYASEALWSVRILPSRPAGSLSDKEFQVLHDGLQKILLEAINSRGTSADSYLDAHGKPGEYVPKLKVYDRDGKPCLRHDGGIIKKATLGGRGTYWCPVCQK